MPHLNEPCFYDSYSSLNRKKAAPYINVQVKKVTWQNQEASSSTTLPIKALLDTGSSITLVPSSILRKIGASPTGYRPVQLRGIDGTVDTQKYPIEIHLCNFQHEVLVREWKIEWKIMETKHMIIGRDILNKYGVLFDGFGLISDELKLNYHVWDCVS